MGILQSGLAWVNADLHQVKFSTMMSSTKFWFLLLDSVTGQPYEGTMADFVSLHPDSVVTELRDNVLSKNVPIITNIVPSQLLMYKAQRRKGRAAEVFSLSGWSWGNRRRGTRHCHPIIVVVDSAIQPSSFPLCQVPFFNSIFNATESDGGWISFGQNIVPLTSLSCLYICKCYRTIAASIINCNGNGNGNGIQKAIITGTLGIGKLLFLIYLLWKLVKERKRVLFIYHPFNIYYDGNGGVVQFETVTCLLISTIPFGMPRFGVCLMQNSRTNPILATSLTLYVYCIYLFTSRNGERFQKTTCARLFLHANLDRGRTRGDCAMNSIFK
ncbi:LOW QUALITY PROTEIN: hypothetical protein ACHAXA_008196 [Cyclostephanos tholiformis]|uniref:Uncharacterized protein n=1 Tax=Cyclostephanos tholiformis TaxID=382380 RepID=A0ABD3SCI5_9STRA